MSLARAVTKRMKQRPEAPSSSSSSTPSRSQSVKTPGSTIDRNKISRPELISTTNMKAFDFPNISTLRHASSTASNHSAEDSDNSANTGRSRASSTRSRETLTDASSVDSSPTSPAPNHLSGFFPPTKKAPRRSVSSGHLQRLKVQAESIDAVPAIPERALSHSKRAHERLAQKRSLQNLNSMHSNRSSREQRSSLEMFSANATIPEEMHPFGKELEQLHEIAEEFGGVMRDAEYEADMTVIQQRGLATFCAADYLQEIQPLFSDRFANPRAVAWI